uniref:Uncharacterized protein n=1 Tax=Arundo donax TaxID=35708 RepID=A0A0A9FY36_ARUDO
MQRHTILLTELGIIYLNH